MSGCWFLGVALIATLVQGTAWADEDYLELSASLTPTYYRYTESFSIGANTEWAEFALLGSIEGRYRSPVKVLGLLRFAGLTSVEGTEENDSGGETTEMHVSHLFNVQPGGAYEWQPNEGMSQRLLNL